jgi:PII-like signaling protein
MRLEGPGLLVRIYIGEHDQWHGKPLYQAIVEHLRERGIAGATVLRGIEGFGAKARLHTTRILRLSEDLPILIEVVDQEERLRELLPTLDSMVGDGLITLERVDRTRPTCKLHRVAPPAPSARARKPPLSRGTFPTT